MEILLVEALVKLLSGNTLQGRKPQQKKWLDYRLAEDRLTILCQGESVPLELLMEMKWREPVKTTDQWVTEARALLAIGTSNVDAKTVAGVLAKVDELEAMFADLPEEGVVTVDTLPGTLVPPPGGVATVSTFLHGVPFVPGVATAPPFRTY